MGDARVTERPGGVGDESKSRAQPRGTASAVVETFYLQKLFKQVHRPGNPVVVPGVHEGGRGGGEAEGARGHGGGAGRSCGRDAVHTGEM